MKLPPALDGLRQQYAANPRLQLAAPILFALLALLAWQELDAWRQQVARRAQQSESHLARVQALRGQEHWLQQAETSARLLESLQAELPQVATPGLARAAVQSEAAAMARALGGRNQPRIDVQPVEDPGLPQDVVRIRATLSGTMSPQQAMDLLQKIEGSTNLAVIEQLDIRSDSNRMASLTFSAYFRLLPGESSDEAVP